MMIDHIPLAIPPGAEDRTRDMVALTSHPAAQGGSLNEAVRAACDLPMWAELR
jgi:hypothetical protein